MPKIAASRTCCSGSDEIALLFPHWRALLCFQSTRFCLWSKAELMMGGKQWKPQRARSGTSQTRASSPSSSDTYLPCLHTHTQRNNPPSFRAHHTFTWDFLTIVVKQAVDKGDPSLHRHPPSSAVIFCASARLPKSRADIIADTLFVPQSKCSVAADLIRVLVFTLVCVFGCKWSCIEKRVKPSFIYIYIYICSFVVL